MWSGSGCTGRVGCWVGAVASYASAGVHWVVAERVVRERWASGPHGTAPRRDAWDGITSLDAWGRPSVSADDEVVVAPVIHIRF